MREVLNSTSQDIPFSGGIVHIINDVLNIPPSPSKAIQQDAVLLSDLGNALTQTDLLSTVDDAKDVTIFAPWNPAFAAISGQTSQLSNQQLANILTYHVSSGAVAYSPDLQAGQQVPTLNGASPQITVKNGPIVQVNNDNVLVPNVLVSNGVVHVING